MAKRKPPPASRECTADPAPASAGIERSPAEEALQKSEQRYRALLQAAPDGIVVANGDGRITEVNRQAEIMFGYERDELVDAPVELLLPERFRQAHVGHRVVCAASPCTRAMGAGLDQFTGRRKDGSEFPIDVALSAVETGEGALTMAVIRDITERKQAEEALRDNEERFRTLYTKTPAMVHSLDTDGNIVTVSDRWLEVLGYERNEVIGRKSTELLLTAESRRYAETVTLPEFWKTGSARDVAYQFVKKNGEIIDVLLSAFLQRDAEGNVVRTIAVLDDITQRKRLEEKLQQAREALEGKVERKMLRKNLYGLTFREFTVLHHIAAGRADKEIAEELCISPLTVHKHVANILSKMNAASRTEAASRALREGLID